MRRIGRSMKEKGYNGSKWERTLQLAEEKWVSSRLEAQVAFGNVAVCTARTLSWKLVMERAKMRSLKRRARRCRLFGLFQW